jgi:hypothetical protein
VSQAPGTPGTRGGRLGYWRRRAREQTASEQRPWRGSASMRTWGQNGHEGWQAREEVRQGPRPRRSALSSFRRRARGRRLTAEHVTGCSSVRKTPLCMLLDCWAIRQDFPYTPCATFWVSSRALHMMSGKQVFSGWASLSYRLAPTIPGGRWTHTRTIRPRVVGVYASLPYRDTDLR